ncbi:MAG: chemotaxis protein CheX [Opitutaceae bacterium]|nr:chemotaxis protein CheX [Opitutaceae bacterium]
MTTFSPLTEEVSELLAGSVSDVLGTAFNLGAVPAETSPTAAGVTQVAAAVGFTGEANGMVYVHISSAFARSLACRMLGLTDAEIESDDMVNDVVGEFANMIVGAVKSRLCDSGHRCVLTIPTVMRGPRFQAEATGGVERRTFHFRCGDDALSVELLMKPAG